MKWCTSIYIAFVLSAPACAEWFCDFDNGTTQWLVFADFANSFTETVTGGNLRFTSNGQGSSDDTILAYRSESFTTTSALMLIRYSSDPQLDLIDWRLVPGFAVRLNPATVSGYALLMNDNGYLQLYKVTGGGVAGICAGGFLQDVPDFTAATDWWMRFEAVTEGNAVRLRGRVWPDTTAEDCSEWQVECVDSASPYLSGAVSLVVNEDAYVQPGNFIELDNVSVRSSLSCQEVCDNDVDDNNDELIDCHDPQCAASPVCQCHAPFADADADGDVDGDDFGIVQRCYTGEGGVASNVRCGCLDRDDLNEDGHFQRLTDGDGDVDEDDLAAFALCRSGAKVPADPSCGS